MSGSGLRAPSVFTLVLLIEILLGAGVVALAVRSDEGPATPTALLSRAQAFVEREQTVRYEGRTSATALDVSFGEAARLRGEAAMPEDFHVTQQSGTFLTEVLVVGGARFVRSYERGEEPGPWTRLAPRGRPGQIGPPEDFGGPFGLPEELRALDAVVSHPLFVSPTGLRDALAAAEAPEIVDRGQDVTELRTRVVAGRLFGGTMAEVDQARLELTVHDDGRIDHVRFFLRADELGVDVNVSYDLHGWGEAEVALEAPPDDEVEEPSALDPDSLAEFDDVPLLMPRAIPDGWSLQLATVLTAEQTVEGCPQAMLVYAEPDDPARYLEVYQFPLGCSKGPPDGADLVPFEVAGRRGWMADVDGELFGELYLDGAVFQFATTLSPLDAREVLAELVPLDLERDPEELPGVGGPTDTF